MGVCLQFGRFTLDMARAALRFDGAEIFPRPKVFGVLRLLAENPGRLVQKQEFFERVWPDVHVIDDVLVQCVRELRRILKDPDHQLIRTVSRRGYMLDASVTTHQVEAAPPGAGVQQAVMAGHPEQPGYRVALEVVPSPLPAFAVTRLYTEDDAERVARISREKQLPLPRIDIGILDDDVPLSVRRFVGVWVSSKGFVNTGRQFMLIVSHVEKEGLAGGYTVRGPPAANSRIHNPAEAVAFTAYIADGVLAYSNPRGSYRVWFVEGGSLIFQQTYITGHVTMVALQPVWTLSEAEQGQIRL
jgi:DNA-binding winged helix-turn-helix (wHTH) protein